MHKNNQFINEKPMGYFNLSLYVGYSRGAYL